MEIVRLGTAKELRQRTTLLDASEVASILNVAKDTVYQWVKRYALPCVRFGDCMRFDPQQLAEWLEAKLGTVTSKRIEKQ
jgi:excisionase family DNA binding protein